MNPLLQVKIEHQIIRFTGDACCIVLAYGVFSFAIKFCCRGFPYSFPVKKNLRLQIADKIFQRKISFGDEALQCVDGS
jgi:hypothetical protein